MLSFSRNNVAVTSKKILAVLSLSATVLASCTIDKGNSTDKASVTTTTAEKEEIKLSANVKDGATGVSVSDPIIVSSSTAIDAVTMTNDAGKVIDGEFNKEKTEFTVDTDLGYGRTYTIEAKSGSQKIKQSFTTLSPTATVNASLAPLDGATVGVGQTIAVIFDAAIKDRQAVQDAITITTNPPVEGAFYWISASQVRWRPQEFWKPGTEVSVDVDLYGKDIGGGVYTQQDRQATFTIGDDVRGEVDDATKTMTFTKNGEVIKTMPVSNGRDVERWATPNGTFIVGDQNEEMTMDSNTFGYSVADGGYITDVKYATQMSYSGIYIHAAPWSEWAQGSTNTSHGCVNVSTANAQWVYENIKRGDIVTVKNTVGRQLEGTDGLGDWMIDWDTWKAGNAEG